MFCSECGHSNPTGNKFCGECGAALPLRGKPDLRESVMPPSSRAEEPETSVGEIAATEPNLAAEVAGRNDATRDAAINEPLAPKLDTLAPQESAPIRENARHIEEQTRANHAIPSTPPPPPAAPRSSSGYGGSSILGLQGSDDSGETDYLLDDAPRRSVNWTAVIGIVLLLAVGGGMLAAWRQAGFSGIRQSASEFWHTRILKERNHAPKPSAEAQSTAQNGIAGSPQANAGEASSAATQPTMTAENAAPSSGSAKPESDQPSAGADTKNPQPDAKKATAASLADVTPSVKPSDEADAATPSSSTDGEAKAQTRAATANKPRPDPAQDIYEKGQNYLFGRGVQQSCAQGVIFTKAAAREGSFRAATQLGALFATGRCVELDRVQAYHWFSEAQQLEPTNSWVEKNRDSLWAQMSEQERAKAGQE